MTLDPSAASGRAFQDGMAAVYACEYDRARPLLERAVRETPTNVTAWFWLALSAPTALVAMPGLRRVIELDPKHADAGEVLGRLLAVQATSVAATNRGKARQLLAEATRVAPDVEPVWIALADISDQPDEVVNALRRAVHLDPANRDLAKRLQTHLLRDAVASAKAGHKDAARTVLVEAAALVPDDPRVWTALARLAVTDADRIEPLRHLMRLTPNQPGVREALIKALHADVQHLTAAGQTHDADARWAELEALGVQRPAAAPLHNVIQMPSPRNQAPPPAAPRPQPMPQAAPQATSHAKTVMVIDDSATIRKILALTLQGAGYAVIAEPDGESALARLREVIPDVILLDITMPNLDGYEVCRQIKKDARTARVPVVMLSGKDGFFDKVKGRVAGATEYLTKPFQAPAVLAVVAAQCQAHPEAMHG
jgi:twitching motility two-component system response regulator PilG